MNGYLQVLSLNWVVSWIHVVLFIFGKFNMCRLQISEFCSQHEVGKFENTGLKDSSIKHEIWHDVIKDALHYTVYILRLYT